MKGQRNIVSFLAAMITLMMAVAAQAQSGYPCVWPRCHNRAIGRTPQLCPYHLRCPEKPEGEQLRQLIWKNDVEGIKRLAPVAGPDYFINGIPPLVHAVYSGNVEAAKALIDAGAYAKWRTATGENLVYFSAMKGKPQMALFFITQGVGTIDDAKRGGLEQAGIEIIARGMEEFLNGQIEDATGIKPQIGAREAFKRLEGAYNNTPPEQSREPASAARAAIQSEPLEGERFPETRSRLLTIEETQSWNPSKLRYAINEIYARHGLVFRNSAIDKNFRRYSWYHPDADLTMEAIEAQFSEIERQNVQFLGTLRNSRLP